MEKVNELRDVPLGHLVKIGRLYYAAIEFLPQEILKETFV